MSRTVYLNGEYLAPEDAKVSIFDRGLLFGDGVYEVAGVLEEVTVTATRRGEADIMTIPVSITALEGEEGDHFRRWTGRDFQTLSGTATSFPP